MASGIFCWIADQDNFIEVSDTNFASLDTATIISDFNINMCHNKEDTLYIVVILFLLWI